MLNEMRAQLDGRSLGRVDTCACTAESLHCLSETITTLFVKQLYPNTKYKVKKKKKKECIAEMSVAPEAPKPGLAPLHEVYALDTACTWTSRVKANRKLRCNGKFQTFTMRRDWGIT